MGALSVLARSIKMSVDINKLDWRNEARHIKVNHGEWNEVVELLTQEYKESNSPYKTTKRSFPLGSYKYDDNKRDKDIYIRTWSGELLHYYTANDDEKNSDEHVTGSEAFKEINKRFVKEYNISLAAAFGVWKRGPRDNTSIEKEYHYELEQCNHALAAIIDCDEFCKHMILSNVYKADISSAYPYQLSKPLPTIANMIGPLKGRYEPLPGTVAFWTKSGHVIAEDVDTRILSEHPLYQRYNHFKEVPAEEEITYILPLSTYSLANVMNSLYDQRKVNPKCKGVMNSFVGKIRSRREYQTAYMGHISALVYARHIKYMCDIYDNLIAAGRYPIMYATDSIMWLGGPCDIAEPRKYLGSFTLEYADSRAIYTSCGNYAIEEKNTNALALVKHQGISEGAWKTRRIESLEDFRQATVFHLDERYNKSTHKYELYEKGDF